jgi:glutathione S-transferase
LERRSARISKSETSSKDYLAINPKGRVPALTGVDGRAGGPPGLLTEARAIMMFLAKSHPAAGLLPPDLSGEARCIEWLNWISGDLHAVAYSQLWRSHRFVSNPQFHDDVQAKGKQNIRDRYNEIEQVLSDGREWALPSGYSIVDPYLLVFWRWGRIIGLPMEEWPRWSAIMRRVMMRPAVRCAMDQEKLPDMIEAD